MAIVAKVKLCSPLNHRVTSFGLLPRACANCLLFSPFSCIRKFNLLEISKDNLVSSLFSFGISLNISWSDIFMDLIIQKYDQF